MAPSVFEMMQRWGPGPIISVCLACGNVISVVIERGKEVKFLPVRGVPYCYSSRKMENQKEKGSRNMAVEDKKIANTKGFRMSGCVRKSAFLRFTAINLALIWRGLCDAERRPNEGASPAIDVDSTELPRVDEDRLLKGGLKKQANKGGPQAFAPPKK